MLITDEVLLNYKRCSRRVFLNAYGDSSLQQTEADFVQKLKRENQTHVAYVLDRYFPNYSQPLQHQEHWQERVAATKLLMSQGSEYIYDGLLALTFLDGDLPLAATQGASMLCSADRTESRQEITLLANPTILVKQSGNSCFGDWSYAPINVHLGRRPKSEYKLLAAFAAKLLAATQETPPSSARLILRQLDYYRVRLDSWCDKLQKAIDECVEMLSQKIEPEVFISRQRCHLCHWYDHCYDKARSQQHLSLIPGVTPSRYENLQALGVTSLESLANVCIAELGELTGWDIASRLRQQARSLLEKKPIWRQEKDGKLDRQIPSARIELYFDIEAEPDRNVDYLLGVLLVDRQQNMQQFFAFLAEKPEDEASIWQNFLLLVELHSNAPIFHFSEYEAETIQRLGNLYNTPSNQINAILDRCFDLYEWTIDSILFPVERYSLKSLANWLGFQWRLPGVSGDRCVCWYDDWLNTGDRSFLDLILAYNEDDCLATFHLKNWLCNFSKDRFISIDRSVESN
jgi:predicted RecB family nuclease